MTELADVPDPLRRHGVYVGRDLERAIAATGEVIAPHVVDVLDDRSELDFRLLAASVGTVTLAYLGWGADVRITAFREPSCFCIQVPVAGEAWIECGEQRIMSSPRQPSVPTPVDQLRMEWSADSAQLILRVDATAVEDQLQRLIGGTLRRGSIRMPLALDMNGAHGARWRSVLDLVAAEIAVRERTVVSASPARGPGHAETAAIEELVTSALLLWHPNNYSELLFEGMRPPSAPYIRRAVDYIHEHLGSPMSIGQVADHVGVSVRALQAGFAREFGMSPSVYVRDLRLDRVHGELVAADPFEGVSVTDVAMRWGLAHLGRMSGAYQVRFGELPSRTLRQPPR